MEHTQYKLTEVFSLYPLNASFLNNYNNNNSMIRINNNNNNN